MTWLCKWWWVLLLLVGAIVVYILSKGEEKPDLDEIITAARAHADAKKLEARIGRKAAKEEIETKYAETIRNMDEIDKHQARDLKDDPSARARFYARVATRRAKRIRMPLP